MRRFAILMAGTLAGCAQQAGWDPVKPLDPVKVVDRYEIVPGVRAELDRGPFGDYYLDMPDARQRIPLRGFTRANLDGVYEIPGGRRVAVIEGATAYCPWHYELIVSERRKVTRMPVGICDKQYLPSVARNTLVLEEVGADDPRMYVLTRNSVVGPVARSAFESPRGNGRHRGGSRYAAAPPYGTADDPARSANGGGPQPATEEPRERETLPERVAVPDAEVQQAPPPVFDPN